MYGQYQLSEITFIVEKLRRDPPLVLLMAKGVEDGGVVVLVGGGAETPALVEGYGGDADRPAPTPNDLVGWWRLTSLSLTSRKNGRPLWTVKMMLIAGMDIDIASGGDARPVWRPLSQDSQRHRSVKILSPHVVASSSAFPATIILPCLDRGTDASGPSGRKGGGVSPGPGHGRAR